MNRIDFAIELAKRLGLDTSDLTGAPEDVKAYGVYGGGGAVAALYRAGIFRGTTGDTFSPNQPMTRAMAATAFARTFNLGSTGPASYTDVKPGQWYTGSVAAVTEAGLFSGTGGGAFNPNDEFAGRHFAVVWGRAGGLTPVTSTDGTPIDDPNVNPLGDPDDPTTPITQDAREYVKNALVSYFNLDPNDMNTDEMREFVENALKGNWTAERQSEEFKITTVYDNRFGRVRREFEARGEDPPEADEILVFEREARALLRREGLPEGFWDTRDEIQDIMAQGVDVEELQGRIDLAYTAVNEAPLEVRAWYAERYGLAGDDALAAVVFDPEKSDAVLKDMLDKAQVGGAGARFGFTLSDQMAARLSEIGVDYNRGAEGFRAIANLAPMFQETHGETRDMTALGEGVDAQFGLGGASERDLQRRAQSRLAAFSGGGGAAASNQGIQGLGSAE